MKKGNFFNLFILFSLLIVVGFFYKRYNDKLVTEENMDTYEAIRKYLLDDETLGKSKKPILWVHVPYEYNSRNWLSFGSRSTFDLNQPYLYLTMRSIIRQCDKSFTICIIDDASFKKLMPEWNIDMTIISDPILSNMRMLGLSKLIYIYGGFLCPLSFVCMRDLLGLYMEGTQNNRMFVCEGVNRTSSFTKMDFFPDPSFFGAPKNCEMVRELSHFIETTITTDYTSESILLGEFAKWCQRRIEKRKINFINGKAIGVKDLDEKQVVIDDLMSNYYLNLCPRMYGILIPAREILMRQNFQWFARLSEKQVLKSNTIIGNYILLSVAPGEPGVIESLEPIENKKITKEFVGFWQTPLINGLFGLKPNNLGNNMQKVEYMGR